jgi:hypothetical protein
LNITNHYQRRGAKRGFWPYWLSIATIDEFTMQQLNQTITQRLSKHKHKGKDMRINLTPNAIIVTDLEGDTAITIYKNNKKKVAS